MVVELLLEDVLELLEKEFVDEEELLDELLWLLVYEELDNSELFEVVVCVVDENEFEVDDNSVEVVICVEVLGRTTCVKTNPRTIRPTRASPTPMIRYLDAIRLIQEIR
jgi:hypothetical protein